MKNISKLTHFFVVDTETTGFSTQNADIIEVSAIEVSRFCGKYFVENKFDMFINPCYPLPQAIVEFNERNNTGICDDFLKKQPKAYMVAQKLYEFLGDSPVLVGHNLSFDEKFINKLYVQNLGKCLEPKESIDTLAICREKFSGSHKLCDVHKLTKKIHSSGKSYHNSLDDCLATLDVLEYLTNKYYVKTFERG